MTRPNIVKKYLSEYNVGLCASRMFAFNSVMLKIVSYVCTIRSKDNSKIIPEKYCMEFYGKVHFDPITILVCMTSQQGKKKAKNLKLIEHVTWVPVIKF